MGENAKPIQLAAIPNGGYTKDGKRVHFTFLALDGREFSFSCPHDAVSEIVECLLTWADLARKERGEPEENTVDPLKKQTARARHLTASEVGLSLDGKQIFVKLSCGPVMTYKLSMPPEECIQLSCLLAKAHAEWESHFRRPTN
jgi:hypothetical protein